MKATLREVERSLCSLGLIESCEPLVFDNVAGSPDRRECRVLREVVQMAEALAVLQERPDAQYPLGRSTKRDMEYELPPVSRKRAKKPEVVLHVLEHVEGEHHLVALVRREQITAAELDLGMAGARDRGGIGRDVPADQGRFCIEPAMKRSEHSARS